MLERQRRPKTRERAIEQPCRMKLYCCEPPCGLPSILTDPEFGPLCERCWMQIRERRGK